MGKAFVGAEAVQDLLAVDRSTVYRMASDGRLPAVKVGRQWRFPVAALEERLQIGEVAATHSTAPPVTPLDPDVVEPMLELLAESLGVMMVVTDMRGRPVTAVVNPCPWFASRSDDPALVEACVQEWRELADALDFVPRLRQGTLGFACARAFVRTDAALVGMVLAGGIAPDGAGMPEDPATGSEPGIPDGLHHLDGAGRERLLDALPRVAAALSRLAGHPADATSQPATPPAQPTVASTRSA